MKMKIEAIALIIDEYNNAKKKKQKKKVTIK